MNSPRVLWLSPWTRPAVRVQAEALLRHGADVLLVTSDQHPESDSAREYELVLDPRFRTAATWLPTLKALRRVRRFRPDIVIAELVRDPRWIALAGRTSTSTPSPSAGRADGVLCAAAGTPPKRKVARTTRTSRTRGRRTVRAV